MLTFDRTPLVSISETVALNAKYGPGKVAIMCGTERLTWGELDRRVTLVANGLIASGLAKGDKVGIVGGNSASMVELFLGINRAGMVAVPLSLLVPAEGLARMLEDSESRALFVSPGFDTLLEPLLPRLSAFEECRRFRLGEHGGGWVGFDQWRDAQSSIKPSVPLVLEDECNIIYSSGTTGTPKGIVHTHYTRQQFSLSLALKFRFTQESVALVTTPLYSNGTWMMYLPAMLTGARLVVMTKFDPAAFLDVVRQERVTHFFMVPPQFTAVLAHPALDSADLQSLEIMVSAGSPLRADTKRLILERLGKNLMELYGLTEGVGTILNPEDVLRKTDSVGVPILGTDIRIIDNDGKELPRGEIGEIIGYSAGMMKWYHRRPEATAETIWIAEDGRTFLKTGDVGKIDEDGFLYILDRKKDMILTGGFNVYPRDIEEVAAQHPDVSEVTVIGIPDPKWDEVPLALVVPRPGSTADGDSLKEWINQRVGKHQRVSGVAFRESFPRNALGKVLKRELRDQYGR